jgi:hypothetical protein
MEGLYSGPPVGWSADLERILKLPKRRPPNEEQIIEEETRRYGKGNVKCRCAEKWPLRGCVKRLNFIQAWSLRELRILGGLLGPIGVGYGKTLLDLLSPLAVPKTRVAVLMVPPNLYLQLVEHDWDYYSQHWNLPNLAGDFDRPFVPGRPIVHVVKYSVLSSPKSTSLLRSLNPDLMVLDESHNVASHSSVRGKRYRAFNNKGRVRNASWTGSMVEDGIEDYGDQAQFALRDLSPVPLDYHVRHQWSLAIDPPRGNSLPLPPGRLLELCKGDESLRRGFRRRFLSTPGVVATRESSLKTGLEISVRRPPKIPPEVLRDLAKPREKAKRPDGEELVTQLDIARTIKQVASGFFYVWRYPGQQKRKTIDEWFRVRQLWRKEQRKKLSRAREGMDSPLLITNATKRFYANYKGPLPTWNAEHWPAWCEIKDKVNHVKAVVWISEWLVDDAIAWGKHSPGIIWFNLTALGKKIAEKGGFEFFGPGNKAARAIQNVDGKKTIVASIAAHGTGRNLQNAFHRNLMTGIPSKNKVFEQLIGRTHRQGQRAKTVTVELYQHIEEFRKSLDHARERAKYIQETKGNMQKLAYATYIGFDDLED